MIAYHLSVQPRRRGDQADKREVTELILPDSKDADKVHGLCFINSVPLNKASQDELRGNCFEHWKVVTRGEELIVLNRFN